MFVSSPPETSLLNFIFMCVAFPLTSDFQLVGQRIAYQIPCISDIYITVKNSNEIVLGVTITQGTVLKALSIRKVEDSP